MGVVGLAQEHRARNCTSAIESRPDSGCAHHGQTRTHPACVARQRHAIDVTRQIDVGEQDVALPGLQFPQCVFGIADRPHVKAMVSKRVADHCTDEELIFHHKYLGTLLRSHGREPAQRAGFSPPRP